MCQIALLLPQPLQGTDTNTSVLSIVVRTAFLIVSWRRCARPLLIPPLLPKLSSASTESYGVIACKRPVHPGFRSVLKVFLLILRENQANLACHLFICPKASHLQTCLTAQLFLFLFFYFFFLSSPFLFAAEVITARRYRVHRNPTRIQHSKGLHVAARH